ncbi:hypothetical protein RHECNPAF_4300135 [Rhizobium etli CNPAF512]|nr:hypothetical protein RHECNPAF_4300135 [Rhizobium etli CNPAF512]
MVSLLTPRTLRGPSPRLFAFAYPRIWKSIEIGPSQDRDVTACMPKIINRLTYFLFHVTQSS